VGDEGLYEQDRRFNLLRLEHVTMIPVRDQEFDARLLTGIRVALRKARELGYPVERMDVTASVLGGLAQCTSPHLLSRGRS
jgi:hypothetical protein